MPDTFQQKLDEFARIAASEGAAGESIGETERLLPRLCKDLTRYDPKLTCATLGGLLTIPTLHANTLRLELLAHVCVRNAHGRARPTRRSFARWINKQLGALPLARFEDPVEDVFISNVVSKRGNHRIFEGVWESNDFWPQEVLEILYSAPNREPFIRLRREIESLLVISDAVAERSNLPRFTMGSGNAKHAVELPNSDAMEALGLRVIFRSAELEAVGVSLTDLEPFISEVHAFSPMGAQSTGSTDLERRPLVRFEDEFILAVPAAISLAIRRHLLERLRAGGQLTNFSQHLRQKQLLHAVFHGLEAFGVTPIKPRLPTTAAELPAFQQTFAAFDEGKSAHLVVLYDSLHRAHAEGICSMAQCPPTLMESLADYLGACAQSIASQTGYSGGLTVVVFGGIGRAATAGLPDFPERWHWVSFSLPDFLRLGGSEGISLLKLWKLRHQQEALRGQGIGFGNINGHLNLYAYWCRQDYSLIPKECPFASASLAVGTDFVAEFRHSLRLAYDAHGVLRGNPGEWITVERIPPAPMFAGQLQSSYANRDEAIEKVLHGVVETPARGWWLLSKQQHSDGRQRSIQLQVWDAILTWLEPLARELEHELTTLPAGPVHVELIIQDLDRWEGSTLPTSSSDLSKDVDAGRRIITLTVPMKFLALFGQPTNIAERTILENLVEAVGELSGLSLSSATTAGIVRRVLPDEDTRCFHMFRARSYRDFMLADAWPKPKPRFVRDEDVAFGRIGLAWAVLEDRTQRKINGARRSQKFLNDVVDVLWQRTITRVKQINRRSLIHRCLTNIDATELDHRQWESTAKAFLAAHGRHEEVTNAAQKRDTQRNMALMASRILIEMAICESPMGGGRTVNTEDLDACAAEVQVLIETASQSDILNSGLSGETPRIKLHPNGQFDVPNTFYNEVLRPYLSGNFRTGFLAAAESATMNYAAAEDENGERVPLDPDFITSFEVEFGVTPTMLFSIVDCLEEVGRIKGTIFILR